MDLHSSKFSVRVKVKTDIQAVRKVKKHSEKEEMNAEPKFTEQAWLFYQCEELGLIGIITNVLIRGSRNTFHMTYKVWIYLSYLLSYCPKIRDTKYKTLQ